MRNPNGTNNQISGITVIKENNIVMSGNIAHGMMPGSQVPHQTNMMGRRLADQGHNQMLNNSQTQQ